MDSIFSEENENTQEIQQEEIKIPKITPENPFENFTEYERYNSDYREIVPQIDIPGCVIPFEPSKSEKKNIRRCFNTAGAGVLINHISAFVIFNVMIFIIQNIVMKSDGISASNANAQYLKGLQNFINESSISIGLCAIIYTVCNVLTFLAGSKVSKIKISSYFRTTDLNLITIFSYFIISLFLKTVSGFANTAFYFLFDDMDMNVGLMDFQNPKAIIISILYGSILAPVGEELMYRGFVLKNLSRVSQRFGIFVSALLFGLMHGNFNQFFLAFIIGIFWAHIDVKHNSLIPSIITHALLNSTALLLGLAFSNILDNTVVMLFVSMSYISLMIAGFILFIGFYKNNRLPYTMPHQKRRNGTAISSVLLIASIAMLLAITIINSFPELLEEPLISLSE